MQLGGSAVNNKTKIGYEELLQYLLSNDNERLVMCDQIAKLKQTEGQNRQEVYVIPVKFWNLNCWKCRQYVVIRPLAARTSPLNSVFT